MVPVESVPALLRRMGQDLFDPPNVKGWPSGNEWITGQSYIERIKFGELLTRGLQPQRYEKELAFICAEGGPAKLSALPMAVGVNNRVKAGKKIVSLVGAPKVPPESNGVNTVEYADLSGCIDALADVLGHPVWQLK
jgi:hypothetical protein